MCPRKTFDGDAGYDVRIPNDAWIRPDELWTEVHLGVHVSPPPGVWLELVARSSTRLRGLIVHQGVIDQGYRGELIAFVRNPTGRTIRVLAGDRLVQLIPHRIVEVDWKSVLSVNDLPDSERGKNGLGSTGL